ncbi:MAG: hypothetical protein HN704_01805 [Bacteroidetes bacterium]|jgi:hypothetical protein|nr:hypothetical protein [Bacteroidota bacterium]MBT6686795.1 hypothetical protein [Bacteroidota bacterium]MBT7142368.1 hypothetical protein [Bacteroidota bacterium]MBT7490321.1 hypothetical protein [Bacteroidota bacterium]
MKWILYFLLAFPLSALAQINDDFSDGDFTNNPAWSGDTAKFEIDTNFVLHLNAPAVSDTAILATELQFLSNFTWEFYVELDFNPSSSNYASIYLISNQANLKGNLNGYFVKIGNTNDEISLYKQSGTTKTEIIDGLDDRVDTSPVTVRVKVVRDELGNWELFSDTTGGSNYYSEGTVFDNSYTFSNYFGIFCKYTSTRSDKFYFDEFNITGNLFQDTIPPKIDSFQVFTNKIFLHFSEPLDVLSAENVNNYSLTNFGNPSLATLNPEQSSDVELSFSQDFISEVEYVLSVSNISDIESNLMSDTNISFTYFTVNENDIVINEIMADPYPVVELPDYEYIELYNTKDFDINLNNWKIQIGNSIKEIPNTNIQANSFLIMCGTSAVEEFVQYGETVGVPSFPAILNSGQTIQILDSAENIISNVSFSQDWYQDESKEEGGWSLEKIDPLNTCGDIANWRASINQKGGSPGEINSIFAENLDTIAPIFNNLEVVNSNTISLNFSETLESNIAENPSNYFVSNNIGFPDSAILENGNSIRLIFHNSFVLESTYSISILNISDNCENSIDSIILVFQYYVAQAYDIVINEIMSDPTPSVNLPEFEYIELFNKSPFSITLSDWFLTIGSKTKQFPSFTIQPDEYIIVCSEEAENSLRFYGKTIGILGSTDLTNDGQVVYLQDNNYKIVSSINYNSDWYHNKNKSDGGWSIERIDPNNFCEGFENWEASIDAKGGTPGKINSVFSENPDTEIPMLERIAISSENSVFVFFSENMDSTRILDTNSFVVNKNIGKPKIVKVGFPMYNFVELEFNTYFQKNIIYTLKIETEIYDCAGNILALQTSANFGLPDSIEAFDLVINEVLFNPAANGFDFVEIYNRSTKTLCLNDLKIGTIDDYETISFDTIQEFGYLIFPEEYIVFTENPGVIAEQYYFSDKDRFVKILNLPSYNDSEGTVLLLNKSLATIDEFEYDENMHFDLLNDFEGVSLEKINFDLPSNNSANWHSAAESYDFASPGIENSQFSELAESEDDIFLEPQVFSPNSDGYNDFLSIKYNFQNPGNVGNISVFDARGRLIRNIVRNEFLAISGIIVWDGLNNENRKARIGMYIVYIEIFDLNGNVKKYKKTCVLAGRE